MNANNLKRNLNANVKTLNLRKQIFFPECESTSFLKINLRKILSSFIYYIYLANSCHYY